MPDVPLPFLIVGLKNSTTMSALSNVPGVAEAALSSGVDDNEAETLVRVDSASLILISDALCCG